MCSYELCKVVNPPEYVILEEEYSDYLEQLVMQLEDYYTHPMVQNRVYMALYEMIDRFGELIKPWS